MNRVELIAVLTERAALARAEAERAVDAFVGIVSEELARGGDVTIAGFGSFQTKTRKPRVVANPRNLTEKISVPPVRVAKFVVGSNLKKMVKVTKKSDE